MEKAEIQSGRTKRWSIALAVVIVAVIAGLLVFFVGRRDEGTLPSMPVVSIDSDDVTAAVKRMNERAASIQLDAYHRDVMKAYFALNAAEDPGQKTDAQKIVLLMNAFEQAGAIGSTGQKESYLLLGDYLAVQFEKALLRVRQEAADKGITALRKTGSPAWRELIKLSGSFILKFVETGAMGEKGELRVNPSVPAILFKRRWRVLAGLPHRQDFLPVESLLDFEFVLHHTPVDKPDSRIAAVRRIASMDLLFRADMARSLVLYEAGRVPEALAIAKRAAKATPDDFSVVEFEKFLQAALREEKLPKK